ncbi:MAG: hypothetical protein P8Y17_02260 [Patescibacteria group bacterium]
MVSKKSLNKFLDKIHSPLWLVILLAIILILRIPSFLEPYSYGDEMIYLTLGQGIRQGIPLYKGIYDNKPPLLYLMAAIAGNLFWFRVLLAAWNLATIFLFWKLSQALFPKGKRLQKISTIIFALLTTIPRLEGNIANAELFMIGPIIAAFLIIFTQKNNFKNLFIAGLLFSIATLFKIPAIFDVPAIIFVWIVTSNLKIKKLKLVAKKTLYLGAGLLVPIATTFLWYLVKGAFNEYLAAAYLQNFGYLSSWRPEDVVDPFLIRNGPLLIRAGVISLGLVILYWKRKKLSKQFVFITAWLLLNLFAITLSERPYPHYLLQAVPAVSLLFGVLITKETLEQCLSIIPLALFFFIPVYFNFWYYPVTPYYVRFIKFATKNITKEEYFDSFGGHIKRNYEIAEFLTQSTSKSDWVFVWGGNDSMVYALSRRLPPLKYVADYHIKDFSNQEEIKKLWEEKIAKNKDVIVEKIPFKDFVGTIILINILIIALVVLVQIFLPPQIPLFYGLPEGEAQLAPSLSLIIPSLVSLVIMITNITISYFLKDEILKKFLITTAIGVSIFSIVTTIKIVLLVGSF